MRLSGTVMKCRLSFVNGIAVWQHSNWWKEEGYKLYFCSQKSTFSALNKTQVCHNNHNRKKIY